MLQTYKTVFVEMSSALLNSSRRIKELESSLETAKNENTNLHATLITIKKKQHHHPTTEKQRKGGNFCFVCQALVHATKHCNVVESIMDALEDLLKDCQAQLPFYIDFTYIINRYDPCAGDYYQRKSQLIKLITELGGFQL